jgi:hypothetical protein
MARRTPNSSAPRARPIKQRKPRGLGKGRVPQTTTRYVEPVAKAEEPMTAAERAHVLASLNRRLPLG